MRKPNLMFQGTASSVGKSVLVAGLCRILYEEGHKVAPFKSQNMSLNSFITEDGKEMGRAQVMQAEAAGVKPSVLMNPVLIKPTGEMKAQYIIEGEVYKDMTAMDYHQFKPKLKHKVKEVYEKLEASFDTIILEGAGSPAEINLREGDIVNMGMAELVDAPVILIGDIDRGGVFASLAGTLLLLSEEERARVKGVIINKFRGDVEILKPGLKMLEDIIKIPVLGVVPYFKLALDDEDSVSDIFYAQKAKNENDLVIKIIRLPYMSNFTDFNILYSLDGVHVSYAHAKEELKEADLVIIPGSKNTIKDLNYLKQNGYDECLQELKEAGVAIFGICGGYQMLGRMLYNPYYIENNIEHMEGLNLLEIDTQFECEKTTTQVSGCIVNKTGLLKNCKDAYIEGYEIHMGQTIWQGEGVVPFVEIQTCLGEKTSRIEGYKAREADVYGTYIHGIFDQVHFTLAFLKELAQKRGKMEGPIKIRNGYEEDYARFKDHEYTKLANILRDHLDLEAIKHILYENE